MIRSTVVPGLKKDENQEPHLIDMFFSLSTYLLACPYLIAGADILT